MNDAHVENKKYPRGDLRFPTWIFEKGGELEVRGQGLEIGAIRAIGGIGTIRGCRTGVTHYI